MFLQPVLNAVNVIFQNVSSLCLIRVGLRESVSCVKNGIGLGIVVFINCNYLSPLLNLGHDKSLRVRSSPQMPSVEALKCIKMRLIGCALPS